MIETLLTKKVGIKYPIIQGGMHYVGYASLASAVSNAGGLGIITALTQKTPEDLRTEIRRCKSLTTKPFGVNLTILPMLIPADYDAYVKVICEERVAVIEISGGSPRKYVAQLVDAGVIIIHKSATIKHALKAQADGVHFVEIAGCESSIAGRHSEDDVGTWVLLTKALEKLTVPVIVSGASATGRQLAAALAMGAQGITMGTRFLATKEAPIHDNVKQYLANPDTDEFSTTVVLRSLNNATRVIKNDVSREILKIEKEGNSNFSKLRPLATGVRVVKMFQETGNWNDAMWSCGQSVGLVENILTCEELLKGIVEQAELCLRRGYGCLVQSKL
eukprot:TRINITY_DN5590_c0_g2_i1.p1 TRINITY_DN5590_c0_g2~~TRINITY_DN5590_c0_g2_i1.p1  ORF type:complete len:333 (-),score=56.46 TRINITY_DN5590_c0_g2_i1:123-1121(-)